MFDKLKENVIIIVHNNIQSPIFFGLCLFKLYLYHKNSIDLPVFNHNILNIKINIIGISECK